MSKITKATFKSFVKKNRESLLILTKSYFDGMIDGRASTGNTEFVSVKEAEYPHENNLNIQGVWLVGGGRDYFTSYEKDGVRGLEVSNCCGSFIIGVKV